MYYTCMYNKLQHNTLQFRTQKITQYNIVVCKLTKSYDILSNTKTKIELDLSIKLIQKRKKRTYHLTFRIFVYSKKIFFYDILTQTRVAKNQNTKQS